MTGTMSPNGDICPMKPRSRSPKWILSSRPRVGESPLAMYWRRISSGVAPLTSIDPMLRMRGDMMSRRSRAKLLPTASASWPNERKRPPTTLVCRYSATNRSSSVRVRRIQKYSSSLRSRDSRSDGRTGASRRPPRARGRLLSRLAIQYAASMVYRGSACRASCTKKRFTLRSSRLSPI